MLKNFSELQNQLSAAGKRIEANRRQRIFAVLLFVLVFGAGYAVQAQQRYFVDRADDNTVTTCDNNAVNDCTLRGAIQRANTDGVSSEIQLAIPQISGQTFVLQFTTLNLINDGSLLITSDPIISGANGTNRRAIDGGTTVRVFAVNPGANVTFRNIAINNGGFSAPNDGAAIDNNQGTVTIDNCFFGANFATDDGGAIKNTVNGTMIINNSDFLNNRATSNNGRGGAIWNEGTMTITTSLFRSNKAKDGGAIANSGTLTIRNTTISGNESTDSGGGIYTLGGTVSIETSTITLNKADFPSDGIGAGGGVGKSSSGLTVNVGGSIISGNSNGTTLTSADFDGVLTSQLGYNIIRNTAGMTITGPTTGNQLNVDPKLLPLRNNGGSLMTHALAPNSPAIDKGSQITLPNLATDSRGLPRRFNFPGIPDANSGTDVGSFERQPSDAPIYDFDDDGKTDVSVFRPSNGTWYLQQSTAGFSGTAFGANGDLIAPADYDGDDKTDIAVFRPSNGTWYLQQSTAGFTGFTFGQFGDLPMPGDFDGDGRTDIAVFRPSNGTWYIQQSSAGFTGIAFGQNGDVPTAADYDGDGKMDVAVFRPSNGVWYLNRSLLGFTGVAFGTVGDKPDAADYDGDGKADIAVFRPSNGAWYLQQSSAGFAGFAFGTNGDLPTAADYDGDGKADIAVFRPSNGTWYLQQSTQGFTGIAFGANGDKPVPSAFVP